MFLQTLTILFAVATLAHAQCEFGVFDKAPCCDGVFKPDVTAQIEAALASYSNSATSYSGSGSFQCQYYMCQFQWAGKVFNCTDHFENLLRAPAHGFIQNYINNGTQWALAISPKVENKCINEVRRKYFEDIDNGVYYCSSQAYYFTKCLYETYNSICPLTKLSSDAACH